MGPVGIVGLGIVGGTIRRVLEEADVPVRGYDRYLEIGSPSELGDCRIVFVCVPTPSRRDIGYDLSNIWAVAREVEPFLRTGTVVAVKSTVPPGTSDRLADAFPRLEFASLPEFLVATRPVETFTQPDRVVVGARSPDTAALLTELMGRVAPEAPVIALRPIEAEFTKLCSNALLAARVAMANELASICERYDVPWSRIKAVVGLDRRIGPDHMTVTQERGFGGACLPKDLDGLIAAARVVGCSPSLLEEMADFNRRLRRDDEQIGADGDTEDRLVARMGAFRS